MNDKADCKKGNCKKENRGKQAELEANTYLQNQGLTTLELNFYSRFGEIDIILLQNKGKILNSKTLIFCEVRSRKNMGYGSALESITVHKQQKIIKTAQYFMLKNPQYANLAARFDVVIVSRNLKEIDWIKNAF
ncbi:MAG: YraN family protein [Gammaproteobacteria bacterium]|nr:YraN family protein [Gammaproteobacteria bacterium]